MMLPFFFTYKLMAEWCKGHTMWPRTTQSPVRTRLSAKNILQSCFLQSPSPAVILVHYSVYHRTHSTRNKVHTRVNSLLRKGGTSAISAFYPSQAKKISIRPRWSFWFKFEKKKHKIVYFSIVISCLLLRLAYIITY
jgi:hypothetical protein